MAIHKEHLALDVLYGFVESGQLPEQDLTHFAACETCQRDARWLREFQAFATREKTYEPPEWVLANAEKTLRLRKPGMVRIAEEIIAALIYDSFSEPVPHGVRGRELPARQALYRAAGFQLDLKIQLFGEGKGAIMGQVVSETGNVSVDRLQIVLTEGERPIGCSHTNALGEFIFEGVPLGNYEVKICLADKTLSLPSLPAGNC